MKIKGKKILITGACGFIGSHLAESLCEAGVNVRAFTYYNSFGDIGWLDGSKYSKEIEIIAGDIRDNNSVRRAVKDCDIILHLAALIAIPYSYQAPDSYIDTNIKGMINILQAARDCNVEKVIQTSTSEIYGTAKYVPIDEKHPQHGQSPYAASKIGADHMAMSFYESFDLPVAIVRPFNTYGPRQSARAVIPTVISQILSSDNNKIKLGATSPTRDFNFIDDTVRGFISAMESEKSIGEVINIGSGFEISIGDTVELIANIIGKDFIIDSEEQRMRPKKSEVERLCADNRKAKELIGWEPEYSGKDGLRRGLEKTISWFKEKENLRRYKAEIYNV